MPWKEEVWKGLVERKREKEAMKRVERRRRNLCQPRERKDKGK
jgi:hypothetical protein